jgi:hypothetical protein
MYKKFQATLHYFLIIQKICYKKINKIVVFICHSRENKGVCHIVALQFTFKSILRQKQNYGNSNISLCKNIIFKKSSKRNQNPSRYCYNSIITNLKFQHKPKHHLSKNPHIKIDRPIIIYYLVGAKIP